MSGEDMAGPGTPKPATSRVGVRRIFLRNLAVTCSIGIHAAERAAPQRVLVNVDLHVRAGIPAGDDIGRVVDYDFVRMEVLRLAGSRHFNLQETFAEAIAAACLSRPAVLAARVSTEKPDVYPDCEAVGVEVWAATPEFRESAGLPWGEAFTLSTDD